MHQNFFCLSLGIAKIYFVKPKRKMGLMGYIHHKIYIPCHWGLIVAFYCCHMRTQKYSKNPSIPNGLPMEISIRYAIHFQHLPIAHGIYSLFG
jgi:hypothetical protein